MHAIQHALVVWEPDLEPAPTWARHNVYWTPWMILSLLVLLLTQSSMSSLVEKPRAKLAHHGPCTATAAFWVQFLTFLRVSDGVADVDVAHLTVLPQSVLRWIFRRTIEGHRRTVPS